MMDYEEQEKFIWSIIGDKWQGSCLTATPRTVNLGYCYIKMNEDNIEITKAYHFSGENNLFKVHLSDPDLVEKVRELVSWIMETGSGT